MKITSFNPMIVSKDAESIISLFEDLGFEKKYEAIQIEVLIKGGGMQETVNGCFTKHYVFTQSGLSLMRRDWFKDYENS